MREVITYIAYDGEEFDNREDCEKYEEKAYNLLNEIFNSYRFFIENGQEIQIFLNGIEEGLDTFDYAWNKSKYIRVTRTISKEADDFIYNYFGYDMPDYKRGLYEYENYKGWVKVGE